MNSLLDIGIPCFNSSEHLQQCLQSISAVFSPAEQPLLHIWVIDDDSPYSNEYIKVCEQYTHLNLSYIKNDRNQGPGVCRNYVITHGTGQWVTFIDDDDVFVASPIVALSQPSIKNYDFLRSPVYTEAGNQWVAPASTINGVMGTIWSRQWLKTFSLKFLEQAGIVGGEDAVFLVLAHGLSNQYTTIPAFVEVRRHENHSEITNYTLNTPSHTEWSNAQLSVLWGLCYVLPGVTIRYWQSIIATLADFYNYMLQDQQQHYTSSSDIDLYSYYQYIIQILYIYLIKTIIPAQELKIYCEQHQNFVFSALIYISYHYATIQNDTLMYCFYDNDTDFQYIEPHIAPMLKIPYLPIYFNYHTFLETFISQYAIVAHYRTRKYRHLPAKYWSK